MNVFQCVVFAMVLKYLGYEVLGQSKLGEKCFHDSNCGGAQILCKNQKICACFLGFLQDNVNQKCTATVGASCENSQDCSNTLPNSECYQGVVCDCVTGFVGSTNNRECLPQATSYGSPCQEPPQCIKSFGSEAECRMSKCVCRPQFTFVDGACVPKKDLGESCSADEECVIFDQPEQNIVCQGGQCTCPAGFKREDNDCRPVPTTPAPPPPPPGRPQPPPARPQPPQHPRNDGGRVLTSVTNVLACLLTTTLII